MITLITGKTGNGKTIFAIDTIEKIRIAENRIVYYHGIPELTLDWVEFPDPRKWASLPNGAVIVIDEARAVFPVRPNGSAVPEYVAAFELHRKQGHDVFILTQQPTFIDNHIRKLTDVHYHAMRIFGSEQSKIHKWFTCKDDCDKNRTGSIVTDYSYPKELYGVYKSADLHTIKEQKPFRYYLKYIIPAIVVALCVVAYFAFSSAIHNGEKTVNTSKDQLTNYLGQTQNITSENNIMSDEEYLKINTRRIETIAYSAPKYDKLVEPKVVPIPAACMATQSRCICYTQQGTKMTTEDSYCRSIVANGLFIEFPDSVNVKAVKNDANGNGIIKGEALDAKQQPMILNDKSLRASPSGAPVG